MAAPSSVFAGCSWRLEQCSLSLGASLACNVALLAVILRQCYCAGRTSAGSRGDQPTVVEPGRIEYLEAAPRVIWTTALVIRALAAPKPWQDQPVQYAHDGC
jgi:hypothetical protein